MVQFSFCLMFLSGTRPTSETSFELKVRSASFTIQMLFKEDEIIPFPASSYAGTILLLFKVFLKSCRSELEALGKSDSEVTWSSYSIRRLTKIVSKNQRQNWIHNKLLQEIKALISVDDVLRLEQNLHSTFALLRVVDMNRCLTTATKISTENLALPSLEDVASLLATNPEFAKLPGPKLTRHQQMERAEYFLDLIEREVGNIPTLFVKFMKFASRLIVCSLSLFDVMNMRDYDHSNLVLFLTQWAFMQELSKHDSSEVVKQHFDCQANTESFLNSYRILWQSDQTCLCCLPKKPAS